MDFWALTFLAASFVAALTLMTLAARERPFLGHVGPKVWTLGHAAIVIGVMMGLMIGLQILAVLVAVICLGKEALQPANAPIPPLAVALTFGATILFGAGGLGFLVIYCKRMGWPFAENFGMRPNLRGRVFGIGVCVLLAALPWVELTGGIWLRFLTQIRPGLPESLRFSLKPQDVIALLQNSKGGMLILAGVALIGIAPMIEELVFRGFVYPALKQKYGGLAGAVIVSLFFASVHANVLAFVPLVVLSLALVLAYEMTGSIVTPMIVHGAFNAVSFVQLLLERFKPS